MNEIDPEEGSEVTLRSSEFLACHSAVCKGKISVYYLAADGYYSCGTCCRQVEAVFVKARIKYGKRSTKPPKMDMVP